MQWATRFSASLALGILIWLISAYSHEQSVSFGNCKPVSERTTKAGCWILVDQPIGRIEQTEVFWHLDVYPSRAEAESAKGPRGTVIESLEKVWLLTIESAGWRPPVKGERVAQIGPLPVSAGEHYSAVFMESISTPGSAKTSPVHTHPGPEAWYMLAGETCLETPNGKLIGRAGGPAVIVPGGLPMVLTATGTEQRRALTLILYDSAKPPASAMLDWTPKGLCRVP